MSIFDIPPPSDDVILGCSPIESVLHLVQRDLFDRLLALEHAQIVRNAVAVDWWRQSTGTESP